MLFVHDVIDAVCSCCFLLLFVYAVIDAVCACSGAVGLPFVVLGGDEVGPLVWATVFLAMMGRILKIWDLVFVGIGKEVFLI